MSDIVLTTINARYIHSALGLRYLFANLGNLQTSAQIIEFTLQQRPIDVVEKLLALSPRLIGFGVYIWNVQEITDTVAILKQIRPDICVVLGGPEISHETEQQTLMQLADYVITGTADYAFAELCHAFFSSNVPTTKIIQAPFVPLETLQLPYQFYSDEDIAHRIIYVEASRGCPFRCEFCLSALDKTVKPFDLKRFLNAMDMLWQRGVRRFKFVDRTFNLKIDTSIQILEFFLARLDENTFLHFELIPDHLPERLKQVLQHFPAGSLQFEIGVQTFTPTVQTLISRRQDNEKTAENLRFLRKQTHVHIHADLIAGLPSDTLEQFAASFDQLVALNPHEIQLGILKRLRGSPIIRHTIEWQMVYNPMPPYNILQTRTMSFHDMQRISRFARYWDLIANSGRFLHSKPILLDKHPFARFMRFSDWLYTNSGQTHKIALDKLFAWLFQGLTEVLAVPQEEALTVLQQDVAVSGLKKTPSFLQQYQFAQKNLASANFSAPVRQTRHVQWSAEQYKFSEK